MENKINDLKTASEVLIEKGLDFSVKGSPIYDNNGQELSEFKAIQREDNGHTFQVAKKGYQIIQNSDALSLMDEVVGTGMAKYSDANSYKNGGIVSVRVKLPFDYEVVKGDEVNTYLDLLTSHDGSKSLSINLYELRLVCLNGMRAMVRTKAINCRHTVNYRLKIEQAQEMFEEYRQIFQAKKENYQRLAKSPMNGNDLDTFLNTLLNIKEDKEVFAKTQNVKDTLTKLFVSGKGNNFASGSKWSAFNAVTEYVNYHRTTKGDESNREFSSLYGSGNVMTQNALELLSV